MGVRAVQARIECNGQILEDLWRTHRVFNDRLPQLLKLIFRMRRGECGRTKKLQKLYQMIALFIVDNSQNAEYLLNSVSTINWTPNTAKKYKADTVGSNGKTTQVTGDCWADQAAQLSAKGSLLYVKEKMCGDLPASMRQMICRETAAIINGHEELTRIWQKDHLEWLEHKKKWESREEGQLYLRIRDRFESFEQSVGGKTGKRRGRWHLYLTWLRSNPDLAAWRGAVPVVHPLSTQAQKRIRKAKPWKTRSMEAEEFWKANPEIHALDKLHGDYEREFVRRRKTKRNSDGFDHRPTFTMPHPISHPRWFVFNAPQTSLKGYVDLELPAKPGELGELKLYLLTSEKTTNEKYPGEWVTVRFRSDPRLARFRTVKVPVTVHRGKDKGKTKEKDGYEFYDPHLLVWRPAKISGVRLIFKRKHGRRIDRNEPLKSLVPYLVFTVSTDDIPLTKRAKKIEWTETGEVTKTGKPRKKRKLPDGLVTCAVDLGLRHIGFATLCDYEDGKLQVLRSRNIWLDKNGGGPDLAHIGRHKREIRKLRRQRGKPVLGEMSHMELQRHITHMGEDRFKKAARGIINFAWNIDQAFDKDSGEILPRADVIVLENLEGFIPDAARERGINRALAAWNRGQLVDRLKEMATDAGYKGRIFEIHPAGTSQVCSRCGSLGRRYSIVQDGQTKKPNIRFGCVEKLFACPACGYRANSDHNASLNLHRKFLLGDSAVKAFLDWRSQPDTKRRSDLEGVEQELRDSLRNLHHFRRNAIESQF